MHKNFDEDEFYVEITPSGGYHVIVMILRNSPEEVFISRRIDESVEIKCDGKQGLVNIYPTISYSPISLTKDLTEVKPVSVERIKAIEDFFTAKKPAKKYKNTCTFKGNISRYLADALGARYILERLGYTLLKGGRYDLDANSLNPSGSLKNDLFYDHQTMMKGHVGEIYYQEFYGGDFNRFIADNPDYIESKISNRSKKEAQLDALDKPDEIMDFCEERKLLEINLKDGFDENCNPTYVTYQVEAHDVLEIKSANILAYTFKILSCLDRDCNSLKCHNELMAFTGKLYSNNQMFDEWAFNCKIGHFPKLKTMLSLFIRVEYDKHFRRINLFRQLVWEGKELMFPERDSENANLDFNIFSGTFIGWQDFVRIAELSRNLFTMKGTLSNWHKFVWARVKHDPYVQLCTLTAVLGHYAGVAFEHNFGINLSSPTSTGKSLTLAISGSTFGDPSLNVKGLNVTKSYFNNTISAYNHSTYIADDLTNASLDGLSGILGVLLQDEYHAMRGTSSCFTSDRKASMCLIGASEKPIANYFRRHMIPCEGGRLNRYIDVPMKPDKRKVPIETLIEARQACFEDCGHLIREVASIVAPSTLKTAISMEIDAMREEISSCANANKRILINFCHLKALARCLEDNDVLDLPDVQNNLNELFFDTVNTKDFYSTQANALDREIIEFLASCMISSKHSVKNVRNYFSGGVANNNPILPQEMCIVRDYESESSDECKFYVITGRFESLVDKYTSATKSEMYEIMKRHDILDDRRQASFRDIGLKRLSVRAIKNPEYLL